MKIQAGFSSMKIMWIGGNHPRHLHYLTAIHKNFGVANIVLMQRENILPVPPPDISTHDRENFTRHFEGRDKAEKKYFSSPTLPDIKTYLITDQELNTVKTAEYVKQANPDLVLLFGPGLVKDPLLSVLPANTINLHLGISPRYRGAATLFWPFYFLEPPYAGSTFHYIVLEPDAGEVIHQSAPVLSPDDGIHDVACKTVVQSAQDAVELIRILKQGKKWKTHKQKGTGKNFLVSDFKPEHLRVNYDLFDDRMVQAYLEGRLKSKVPTLFKQF